MLSEMGIKLSLDDKLSQKYSYQKLLKSDNPFSRYSRKCFWDTVYSDIPCRWFASVPRNQSAAVLP